MNKVWSYLGIAGLFVLFLAIRAFENTLFYDPLINYFKGEYKTMPLPKMNNAKLLGSLSIRFLMNTSISLLILYLLFKSKEIIKLSMVLYAVLFLLLMLLFSLVIFTLDGDSSNWILFYIRRFLMHPIFLILLIPAFYFQNKKL